MSENEIIKKFFIPYLTRADMMLLHHPDANDVKAYNVIEQFVADGNFRNRRSAQRILRTSHFAVEPAKKCGRDSRFR